jgi:hypothetical protein
VGALADLLSTDSMNTGFAEAETQPTENVHSVAADYAAVCRKMWCNM